MRRIHFGRRRIDRRPEEIELYVQKLMYQEPEFDGSGRLVATNPLAMNRQLAEINACKWAEEGVAAIRSYDLLPEERLLNCGAVEARLQALRWGKQEFENSSNLVLIHREGKIVGVLLDAKMQMRNSGFREGLIISAWPDSAELLFDLADVVKVFGDGEASAAEEGDIEAQNTAADCDKNLLPKRTGTGAETISEYLRSGKASSDFTAAQLVEWMLVQQDGAKGKALWRQKKDRFTRSDGVEISRGGLRKAVQRYHDDIRFGETATTASET